MIIAENKIQLTSTFLNKVLMSKTIRNLSLKNIHVKIPELSTSQFRFLPKRLKTEHPHKKSMSAYGTSEENSFIITRKLQFNGKQKRKCESSVKQNKACEQTFSNFQKLKMQAKKLENSQFLRQTPANKQTMEEKDPLTENRKYIVNNEFASSKRVSLMDRYRHNIKKIHAKRKQQNIISSINQNDSQFNSSFNLKRVQTESTVMERTMENMKKRTTCGGAKRFYNRPTSKVSTRAHSMIDSHLKAKAIGLKSKDIQKQKNNQVVIICM